MHPTTARSSRSSLHHPRLSPVPSPSAASSVYQQAQRQQILYAPISKPMVTLQPCGTALHPSCIYPTGQPHVELSNSAAIHPQGKNNRWQHSKNKPSRGQQHYQQQQQLSYPKPMMLFEQASTSVAPAIPPSTTSFLVASSTFTHGPLPGEHYGNSSGVTHLLPQPYFKPPDMAFCLIQDRNAQQQQSQQQPMQASYYNISATNAACSLQTVNASPSFPLASISPYSSLATFGNNQFPASVQPSPLFSSSPLGLVFGPRDKPTLPALEFPSFKHSSGPPSESRVSPIGRQEGSGWPPEDSQGDERSPEPGESSAVPGVARTDEERYSDASSASFDFTIEAEKMVSALCNTTSSNDLTKEESRAGDSAPLYSGAGDNVSNKTAWFAELCPEYENGTSIGVQTDGPCADRSQYPELIRKTAYWACTEAELVLGSERTDPRRDWLTCLSSATKTAIAKSSTCIPVYAGDRVFADDLINALLRISNGWLSLDNYLNKQHFPNLLDRLEPEFVARFHTWQESTHELLKQIVRTFARLGENEDVERKEVSSSSSFPGDVSLYTNRDLFAPPRSLLQQRRSEKTGSRGSPMRDETRGFRQEQHSASHKESKLRSKWTITENLSSVVSSANKFRGKRFAQKSLNAEFCQLRDKVMEGNAPKDRRQAFDNVESVGSQSCASFAGPLNPAVLTCGGYPLSVNEYPRNAEQFRGVKRNASPVYVAGRSQAEQIELPAVPRSKVTLLSQIEPRAFDKESKEMAANLSAWFASMRNAPSVSASFEEASEEPAQRLFAKQEVPRYSSARQQPQVDANRQYQALQNLPNIQSTPWAACNFVSGLRPRAQHAAEEYDSSEDVRVYMKPGSYNVPKKRHQRRSGRRADNNASNHRNGNKTRNVTIPASSTPLSHLNAPPAANIGNSTLIKTSFPSASQLPAPLFSLENSPGILKRAESLSRDAHRDVTWKAACASAEILLEALNVKDCAGTSRKIDRSAEKNEDDDAGGALTSHRADPKRTDVDSSYEASEDDSGSTCRLSPSTSVVSIEQSCDNENEKTCSTALSTRTNVKTDSWLIRTLNNASIVGKRRSVDRRSSGSSNSSVITDAKPNPITSSSTADSKIPAASIDSEYPAIFSREHISRSLRINDETSAKESEGYVGRATYSETVRRSIRSDNAHSSRKESYKACTAGASASCGAQVVPIPGRKCQRKDPEQSYQLLHKSQRSADKRSARNSADDLQLEEESCAKAGSTRTTYGKKKDSEHSESRCANKSADRGWSVWYSSRRKQSLSPLALSKLEMIHRAVWQMDEAKIFKHPIPCADKDGQLAPVGAIENYCRTVKSPMFLEIVDYKLKNRVYHKVEHAVKDFRHIIQSARLCHQHDDERTKKIDALSKKLEDLLEEHFGNWDFGNITGSPREDATVRYKTSGQKLITGRYDSTKKSVTSLTIAEENALFH
ncbi:PREDICTED: uncharacterized protein LOC106748155 [Dinoponera quadriceps]|uniref:Uncharacterized protein LOC106748155 n=1 Tax=Dinoponera quadriceps TaxID=609295 RepID=A0A6P3XTT4_DINQU|nr:PREDICTED: uncharacterized protein LOC106748155 [Dinoponera quadriceps]